MIARIRNCVIAQHMLLEMVEAVFGTQNQIKRQAILAEIQNIIVWEASNRL
jgi:hypothetical protein